jgi:voltage-gated potassium channel
MGVRRMMKTIEGMRGQYIICGYGRLGRQVVRDLEAGGVDFVVVESDAQRAADARDKGCVVVEGDAADEEVLRKAGLDRCAGLASTISDDAENIYIGLTARSLRPEVPVVCRSSSTRVRALFERAGIHRIISTEELGARRLVSSLTRPYIVDFLDEILSREQGTPSLQAIRLEPGAALVGQTLEGARLPNEYDVVVLAIRREGQPILPNPGPRERLEAGDLLIAIGKPEQVERLRPLVEGPAAAERAPRPPDEERA